MIDMCQDAQVSYVSRVSLQCNNLIQASESHGRHLKQKSPVYIQLVADLNRFKLRICFIILKDENTVKQSVQHEVTSIAGFPCLLALAIVGNAV